jgi:hypothetical protein
MHAQWLLPTPDLISSEEASFSHKYKSVCEQAGAELEQNCGGCGISSQLKKFKRSSKKIALPA